MVEQLTMKETAERLGVSERTIRRWIKTGKLDAELVQTGYGPTWMVSGETLHRAAHVLDVVKVERPTDPQTLALAVARGLNESQKPLMEKVERLQDQIAALQEGMQKLLARTEPKVEQPPVESEKRRWWKKLFEP